MNGNGYVHVARDVFDRLRPFLRQKYFFIHIFHSYSYAGMREGGCKMQEKDAKNRERTKNKRVWVTQAKVCRIIYC